jgi:serine acetyltransferase
MKKLLKKIYSLFLPHGTRSFWKYRRRILFPKGIQKIFKPYYSLRAQWTLDKLNSSIPITERIRPFQAPHGLCGIFISYGARVGKGCTIFQQVTIGSNTMPGSKKRGAPVIGDRVYIGAGAKIIGGITIGNDVRIGANCIVTDDIPANSTVVMEKPRVITYDEPRDNTFVSWDEYSASLK